MPAATHRVIGVMEWPARTDMPPQFLESLRHQLIAREQRPAQHVLSLRLPVSDAADSEVLTADLGQLGLELCRLFDDFVSDCER